MIAFALFVTGLLLGPLQPQIPVAYLRASFSFTADEFF